MKRKTALAIALSLVLLTGCGHVGVENNIPTESAASMVEATVPLQAAIPREETTAPSIPQTEPSAAPTEEVVESSPVEQIIPVETILETIETIPVEEIQSFTPDIPNDDPEPNVSETKASEEPMVTEPVTTESIETEPPQSVEPEMDPTQSVEPETEPEKQPVPESILRELEAYGRSYGVSAYGYQVDVSMGFSNSAYYPGMWGWFNANDYSQMQSLVRDAVDITTENLISRSGPIWGYREDNGTEWHTRINITIVDDGDGMYTCWVFYG